MMINSNMKDEKDKKPNEELQASVAARLVIKDKKADKVIVKTRG